MSRWTFALGHDRRSTHKKHDDREGRVLSTEARGRVGLVRLFKTSLGPSRACCTDRLYSHSQVYHTSSHDINNICNLQYTDAHEHLVSNEDVTSVSRRRLLTAPLAVLAGEGTSLTPRGSPPTGCARGKPWALFVLDNILGKVVVFDISDIGAKHIGIVVVGLGIKQLLKIISGS